MDGCRRACASSVRGAHFVFYAAGEFFDLFCFLDYGEGEGIAVALVHFLLKLLGKGEELAGIGYELLLAVSILALKLLSGEGAGHGVVVAGEECRRAGILMRGEQGRISLLGEERHSGEEQGGGEQGRGEGPGVDPVSTTAGLAASLSVGAARRWTEGHTEKETQRQTQRGGESSHRFIIETSHDADVEHVRCGRDACLA